jgi:plastocyanin
MPSAKATTYAVPSSNYTTEGRYYEYYTEAVCNVVAVSADKSEVYVSYEDDVYCFNANNTECQPGDKITVTFNEAMQIVNAE